MASTAYVKIQIGADLRRIVLQPTLELPTFKSYVWSLHGTPTPEGASIETMTIKYRDSEGDLVTLGSTEELRLFIDEVLQKKEVQQRLFVSFEQGRAAAPTQAAAPQAAAASPPLPPPPAPPRLRPEQIVANALSDAEAVRCLQNAVASPAINDAVIQVAQGFASGGPLGAWVAVAQAVPTARAVLDEAMDGNSTLSDARKQLLEAGIDVNDFGSCMSFAGRGFGGAGGCQRLQQHRWGQRHGAAPDCPRQGAHHAFHPWVVCDGCSDHPELKAQSLAEGHRNGRGWIAGPRHKSLRVDDFDLCQSCVSTGRFNSTHGPFEVINREHRHGWGGGHAAAAGGSGCGRPTPPHHPHAHPHPHHAHPHHGHPHHHPHAQHQQPDTSAAFLGGMPFFEWARHHHNQPQPQQQHQARGCRGSRRDLFSGIFRDVVAQGASAFEQVAKDNDNEELASLARAFTESFRSNSAPQQQNKEESSSKPAAAASSSSQLQASAPAPVDEPAQQQAKADKVQEEDGHNDEEEWEVPDVSPAESEDPIIKWQAALQQLALLGFTESENYIEFLEEEGGDLEAVVNRIVRRAA